MSTFHPTAPPQDVRQIPQWLNREMLSLKQALERAAPHITREYLHAEPSKIVAGMEVLADGTDWDPGGIGVAGLYRRSEDNATWELIETASALAAHLADTSAAHAASAISFTPAGTIAATDVQAMGVEVAADAAAALAAHEAAADPHPGYLTAAEGNAAYQPLDADLTSWAVVTRAAGYDTFAATPNSANLKALVTDETGSGGGVVFATGPTITDGTFNSSSVIGKANAHAAGFDLLFGYNSPTASANRSVTWDVNNSSRTFNLFGNLTVSAAADVSGTNTGDEDLSSIGTKLDSAAAKNPPVDADVTIILDSADSNAPKKLSWLNLKATLKTYFDTLYQPLLATLTSWGAITRAAGFDTFAATPSSANLKSLVTDETGSGGALVFATGPTIAGAVFNDTVTLGKANDHAAGFDLRFEYNSATASADRSVTWDLNNASRTFNLFGNLVVSAAADVSGTNSGDEDLASIGTKLNSAAAKATPVDADVAIILDSADSAAPKKLSWLNIKTTLDARYQGIDADLTSWAGVTRAAGFDTFTATPSSANLRSLLTDESGTGAAYFQGGDLGTPSAGVLTNATGYPATALTGDLPYSSLAQGSALSVLGVTGNATADNASIAAGSDHQVLRRSGTAVAFGAVNLAQANAITGTLPVANGGTGVTSLGSGIATWLGTPSSANLAAAMTDETGTAGTLPFQSTATFTPTLTFGGGSTGMTFSTQTGRYIRTGNQVSGYVQMVLTNKGSSTGNMLIGNLPFTALAGDNPPVLPYVQSPTSGVGDTHLQGLVLGGSVTMRLEKLVAGTSAILTHSDFTNTTSLRIDFNYFV